MWIWPKWLLHISKCLNKNNGLLPSSGDHDGDEYAMYNQDSRRKIKTDKNLPIKLDEDKIKILMDQEKTCLWFKIW